MRQRRFIFLATGLVTLNLALLVVPQGLALQRVIVSSLFGKKLVRADVVVNQNCSTTCSEWRVARGVVVTNAANVLTIKEVDAKVEAITTSSSTKVTGTNPPSSASGVKAGWRVLVTWPAPSGTADSVVVEKK